MTRSIVQPLVAALGAFALAAVACTSPKPEMMSNSPSLSLSRQQWDAARSRTVFFGHQSVGDNILDGLRQIAEAERWPAFNIVEAQAGSTVNGPALLHSKVGQNGDPTSKLTGFRRALEGRAGAAPEVAVVKFCFWDIRSETDVDAVFASYRETLDALGREFPGVTFMHATVPLVVEDRDWRAGVRRLLRMAVPTDGDNAAREALNRKIRGAYGSGGALFDIAALEQAAGVERGSKVPYLADEFSSDGAHLNHAGRQTVAAGLVRTLAGLRTDGAAPTR